MFVAKDWEKRQIPPWLQRSLIYDRMMVSIEQWAVFVFKPEGKKEGMVLLEGLCEFKEKGKDKKEEALGVYVLLWLKDEGVQKLKWIPTTEPLTIDRPTTKDQKSTGLYWVPSLAQQVGCPLDAKVIKVKEKPDLRAALSLSAECKAKLNEYQTHKSMRFQASGLDVTRAEKLLAALSNLPAKSASSSGSSGTSFLSSASGSSVHHRLDQYQAAFKTAGIELDIMSDDKDDWMEPEIKLDRLEAPKTATPVVAHSPKI